MYNDFIFIIIIIYNDKFEQKLNSFKDIYFNYIFFVKHKNYLKISFFFQIESYFFFQTLFDAIDIFYKKIINLEYNLNFIKFIIKEKHV